MNLIITCFSRNLWFFSWTHSNKKKMENYPKYKDKLLNIRKSFTGLLSTTSLSSRLSFILNFRISFFFFNWISLRLLIIFLFRLFTSLKKTRFTSFIFINIHNTLYSTFSPYQFNASSFLSHEFELKNLKISSKKQLEVKFVLFLTKKIQNLSCSWWIWFHEMISTEWNLLCINLPH